MQTLNRHFGFHGVLRKKENHVAQFLPDYPDIFTSGALVSRHKMAKKAAVRYFLILKAEEPLPNYLGKM